jgi:putative lipoprotein
MYAELIGHLQPPSANGLDNDFTARFIVDGINLISAENLSGCQQPSQSTRVFGTEPFWGIKFVGHSLQQSQPGMAAELYPITSRQITANKRQYTIEQGQLTLKKQRCDDGMSDSVYGWQATFVRNDHALEGCAVLSGQDATLGWAGQYQAVSSKDAALRISLELQPDHSATLVYSNTRQRSDIRESGFWQQINPQQLQLVITRYQDQQIHVTRLFTLEGNKLTAKEEDVNGKRYSISDGGLVLYRSAL